KRKNNRNTKRFPCSAQQWSHALLTLMRTVAECTHPDLLHEALARTCTDGGILFFNSTEEQLVSKNGTVKQGQSKQKRQAQGRTPGKQGQIFVFRELQRNFDAKFLCGKRQGPDQAHLRECNPHLEYGSCGSFEHGSSRRLILVTRTPSLLLPVRLALLPPCPPAIW
ncbi:hypothetical protein KUCAC02_012441, partial [Chaenocephalus aceratus]